jgi:hypothetical protein
MAMKVKLGDREYDAREEEFEIFREEWNEYRLMAGGRLRLKTIVHKIYQVLDDDGKPLIGPDGEYVVFVKHNSQVVVSR